MRGLPPLLDAIRNPAHQRGIRPQHFAYLLPFLIIAQPVCKPFQPLSHLRLRNGFTFHRRPHPESLQKGQHVIDIPAHYC